MNEEEKDNKEEQNAEQTAETSNSENEQQTEQVSERDYEDAKNMLEGMRVDLSSLAETLGEVKATLKDFAQVGGTIHETPPVETVPFLDDDDAEEIKSIDELEIG